MYHRDFTVDNRDTSETWLHIEMYDGPDGHLRIDPWDLLKDLIQNAPVAPFQISQMRARVQRLRDDLSNLTT